MDGANILCPYCSQSLWIAVDRSGGEQQRFVTDCEVCCQPIECHASIDPESGETWIDALAEGR